MISKKYLPIVQTFILSGLMSFIISGVLTLIHMGFIEHFFLIWMKAWVLAYAIAFPTVTLVFPFARKLAMKIASKE